MERKNRIFTGNRQQQKQKVVLLTIAASAGCALIIYIIMLLTGNLATTGETKAAPGLHGDKVVSSGTVILNEYTYLTSNVSAGGTQLTVSSNTLNANGRFSGNLAAGELVMIIQIQGATISETNSSSYGSISSYNNCGKFEFAEVASLTSTTKINLTTGLTKSYTAGDNVQVIRVPRYKNLTVNAGATVTCPVWNGSTGGIVAIEVNNVATINGIIDVSGKGFRGGALEQQSNSSGDHTNYRSTDDNDGGEKGESIAGYQGDYIYGRYGRGAPANGGGGGNSHNAAGGGGANGNNGVSWNGKGNPDNSIANWTTAWNLESASFSTSTSSGGGRGGYSWSYSNQNPLTLAPNNSGWSGDSRYNVGGLGGRPLDYSTGRIFMGGGGGAGDSNNSKGTDGGEGGGIIYILAGKNVTGSGSLKANGGDAASATGPGSGWIDGPGGGGGGGAVIVYSKAGSVSSLTIEAKGGKGGDWYNTSSTNENEGAGGGGGGGYISTTSPSGLTLLVTGGLQGENKNSIMSNFKPNGGTRGASGQTATNPPNPYSGSVALPVVLTSLTGKQVTDKILLQWSTASELNNNYFIIERSQNGTIFTEITKVEGSGSTTQKRDYSFIDNAPGEKLNYYRLKQTDYNGKTETFQTIAVEMKKGNAATKSDALLFPNPFKDHFTMQINCNEPAVPAEIKISDLNGKVVQFREVNMVKGSNIFEFDNMTGIPPGVYFLNIRSTNGMSCTIRLMKN